MSNEKYLRVAAVICLLTLVACYLVLSAATWVTLLYGEGSSGGSQTAVTEASTKTDNAEQDGETDEQDKNDSLRDQYGGMIWLFFAERHFSGGVLTGFLVGVICLLPAVAYRRSLRKALLERRRLYALARRFQYGTGFRAFGFGFVICMTAAVLGFTFLLVNPDSEALVAARVVIHGLVLIAASSLSIWLIHIFDYQDVASQFRDMPASGLTDSLIWVAHTRKLRNDKRLEERGIDSGTEQQTFGESQAAGASENGDDDERSGSPRRRKYEDETALDREHTAGETQLLLDLLRRQLKAYRENSTPRDNQFFKDLLGLDGEPDAAVATKGIATEIEKFGNVVALFHPDYLAHISHVYLKLSQLRALNMPPRRVQLLGRRWTMRGLESEYVVVHDVSDLRSEYRELEKEKEFEIAQLAQELVDLQEKFGEQIGEKMSDAIKKCMASYVDRYIEPKWRQRSLKKRATVTVAPDGSLMDIAIEEERLFNI